MSSSYKAFKKLKTLNKANTNRLIDGHRRVPYISNDSLIERENGLKTNNYNTIFVLTTVTFWMGAYPLVASTLSPATLPALAANW